MEDNPVPDSDPQNNARPSVLWIVCAALTLLIVFIVVLSHYHNSKTSSTLQPVRRDQQSGDLNIKFNQTATVGNLKITVTKATLTNFSDPNGVSEASSAPTSNQYLVADVTLEGLSKASANYSYSQFSLLSDSKTSAALDINNLPPGVKTPLGSGAVASGHKINGQVIMSLPQGFKYYYVVFTPAQPSTQRVVIGP